MVLNNYIIFTLYFLSQRHFYVCFIRCDLLSRAFLDPLSDGRNFLQKSLDLSEEPPMLPQFSKPMLLLQIP